MQADITLRPISESDQEFLYRCYASTRIEELALVPWSDADKEAFLRMQFRAQTEHYSKHYSMAEFQVIQVDGRPAGRLYVARWEKEIRIVDITLLPAFRGRGVGSHLLNVLITESEQAKKPLSIHVEKNNPAMRLYVRLGFKTVGDVGVYDLMQRPAVAEE